MNYFYFIIFAMGFSKILFKLEIIFFKFLFKISNFLHFYQQIFSLLKAVLESIAHSISICFQFYNTIFYLIFSDRIHYLFHLIYYRSKQHQALNSYSTFFRFFFILMPYIRLKGLPFLRMMFLRFFLLSKFFYYLISYLKFNSLILAFPLKGLILAIINCVIS